MKVYYIFRIKKEFINLYKDSPSVLYNILRTIYYLDKTEVDYGYNLLKQLTLPIDKNKVDRELFIELHQEFSYSKRKEIHYMNNLYKNEVSRLIINKSYLKLEIEQDFSSFYKILNKKIENLFVCCFKQLDFFFLEDYIAKLLV